MRKELKGNTKKKWRDNKLGSDRNYNMKREELRRRQKEENKKKLKRCRNKNRKGKDKWSRPSRGPKKREEQKRNNQNN